MEDIIKQMSVEQLVDLLNDCADDFSVRFPYIMENDDEDKWDEIQSCMGAFGVANAVSNGRFSASDKWLIVIDDAPEIYTFSDKETLFGFISPKQIAEVCDENGIEFKISYERK